MVTLNAVRVFASRKKMNEIRYFFRLVFLIHFSFRMNEWMKLTGPRGGNDTRLTGMRLYIYLFIYGRMFHVENFYVMTAYRLHWPF